MPSPSILVPCVISLAVALPAAAQAPLEPPPGAPAPSQKSLQEIWDRIDGLEGQVGDLQGEVEGLNDQVTDLQAANSALQSLLLDVGQNLAALPWRQTVVAESGSDPSLGVASGVPRVAYVSEGDLYYGSRTADGSWSSTPVVADTPVAGPISLAISPLSTPAIAYFDPVGDLLKCAFFQLGIPTGSWSDETVTGSVENQACSLAFESDGDLTVAFSSPDGSALIRGAYTSTRTGLNAWGPPSTFAGGIGEPAFCSIAPTPDVLGLAFAWSGVGARRVFIREGFGNVVEIDSNSEVGPRSLAYTEAGDPGVAYVSGSPSPTLRFAERLGGSFFDREVAPVSAGAPHALAFNPAGQPCIAWYDFGDFTIKYAVFNGAEWITVTVAGQTGVFTSTIDLVFGTNGQPIIAFEDGAGRIIVADRAPTALR